VVHEIATAWLPVFLVLALGYGAGRRKFITSPGPYIVVIVIATLSRFGSALGKSARPATATSCSGRSGEDTTGNGRRSHYQ
jgi:hypothetical protein